MKTSPFEKALLVTAAAAVVIGQALFLTGYVRLFRNLSASMEPTLPTDSRMIAIRTKNANRGDLVTFRYPRDPRTMFVKRVVGIGGDLVEIRDKVVFVNGTAITEPYVVHRDDRVIPASRLLLEPFRSRDQLAPYRVPPGHYFVLGDNRDFSNDSRYWGAIDRSDLQGRVALAFSWRSGFWQPR